MKALKITLITAIAVVVIGATAFTLVKNTTNFKAPAKGFAVIELFTSEGCSSCPPADELVSRVQKESAGQPVYILAYHVDYWNRLGWRDPYSSAAYSQRQQKYAQWIHGSSVYTPQIVFNGTKEFIGSQEGTLRNSIKGAEQKTGTTQLELTNVKVASTEIAYHYETEGLGNNTALVVALVQKSAKTDVKAGENSGLILSHVQLVRQLQTVNLTKPTGDNKIEIPKGVDEKQLSVIAFLQNQSNGQITAAFKTEL